MNLELKKSVKTAMVKHERRERLGLMARGKTHSFCSCGWVPDEAGANERSFGGTLGNERARAKRFIDDLAAQWSDHTLDVVLAEVARFLEADAGLNVGLSAADALRRS